ncbi:Ribose-5-phosphate isomerase [Lachnellula occidentalis]|uniref:Ribose-5-phosphate isomerase n=1 Tax=Lachnellula occidentalis TaxID=215460 RepID=A0A8H8UBX6_9HELO|nr:Ribose-5-phosphate isomerase [Lachnellula occidentalis]
MATSASTAPAPENAAPPLTHIAPPKALDTIEAAKRRAAYKAVEDHFDTSYKYIGIGSGSTVVYVVEAIAAKGRAVTDKMYFIPTGDQSKQLIIEAGLPLGSIDSLPPVEQGHQAILDGVSALQVATGLQDLGLKGKRQSLDVAFDGADEIDEDLNCIKGGGACLFQEKLVATAAKKFICVADSRKLQPRLLTKWKSIPIEIAPLSAPTIKRILITLGSPDPVIRQGGSAKAGPVVTDNGMWIIDAPFPPLLLGSDLKHGDHGDGEHGTWEVHHLGRRLKRIVGVLEVGLFHGRNGIQVANAGEEGGGQRPVAAYFGMENGEVEVRNATEFGGVKSQP